MVGFPGPELTPDDERMLVEEMPGAIVLFARNLRDPAGGRALCAALQSIAGGQLPAPFLIGTDQECGSV